MIIELVIYVYFNTLSISWYIGIIANYFTIMTCLTS